MSITKLGKKLFIFIALFGLLFALISCQGGSSDKDEKKAEAQQNTDEIYKQIIWDASAMEKITSSKISLVTKTRYENTKVTWVSNNPDVISAEGVVTRPAYDNVNAYQVGTPAEGEEAEKVVKVKLTATITSTYKFTENGTEKEDKISRNKEFEFTVLCIPSDVTFGTIAEIKAAAYHYIYEEKGVALALSSDNKTVFNVGFYGIVSAKLNAEGAGQFMVHDGTEGIYVYSTEEVNVGDTVFVIGEVYSYYGSLQVGSKITVSVVEDRGIDMGDYTEISVQSWEENFVLGYLGGKRYQIYAKLETGTNSPASDKYKLVDPFTGEIAWIYYKSYNNEQEENLKNFVGKYVNITGVTYDRDSRIIKNHLLWDGGIEEAGAPVLTDEQKVDVAIAGITVPEEVSESFTLSNAATWTVKEGTGITVEGLNATVAQTNENQTVVLTASVTIGTCTKTKDFTVTVTSSVVPYTSIVDAIAGLEVSTNDKATVYVKGYITADSALDKYGNMFLEDFAGNKVKIYGSFGKDSNGEYIFTSLKETLGLAAGVCVGIKGTYSTGYKNISGLEVVEVFADEKVVSIVDAVAALEVAENNNKTVVVKGVITADSALDKYGNMFLEDSEGNKVKIYGAFGKDGTGAYVFPSLITSMGIEKGGVVVIKGTYSTGYKNISGLEVLAAFPAPAELTDEQKVAADKEALKVTSPATADFTLPTAGANGSVITWAIKEGTAIALNGAAATVTRPAVGQADATVVLTATITVNEAVDTKEITVVVSAEVNQETLPYITTPEVGKDFTLALFQENAAVNKVLYFTGAMNGYYFATSEFQAEAVKVQLETTTGGYYVSFMINSEKKYIGLELSGTYKNVKIHDTATTVWTFNTTYNTLVTTLSEVEYYLGTYSTYNTFSASSIDKAATSYVGHLYKIVDLTDEQKVAMDKAALTVSSSVMENFTLPTSGVNGSVITWAIKEGTAITLNGAAATIARPAAGQADATVVLTATIKVNAAVDTKEVTVVVKAMPVVGTVSDLFFSEYGEGSSNNKYLEIYNGTDNAIDLSGYTVKLYTNGYSTASKTHTFENVTIAAKGTYVLYHSQANATIKAVTPGEVSEATNYNGDDAIALYNGETLIDLIGIIGTDPGDQWTGEGANGSGSTKDKTLVRVSTVTSGNTTFTWSEWNVYAKDTLDYLGSH